MSSPSARFLEKSSAGFSKMAMRLVSRSTISLPLPSLAASLKSGQVGQLVGVGQRGDDLLVDLVADVALALEGDHVLEARALRDGDRRVGLAGVLVADVLDEQQDEDVVLVLAGVHAAAQLVAARPEGGVEFGFLQGHRSLLSFGRLRLVVVLKKQCLLPGS